MVQREKKRKQKQKALGGVQKAEGGGGDKSFYGQIRDLFVFVLRADPSTSITARPFSSVILGP